MDSAKKQRERFFVDRFLELQGHSPTEIQQLPPPDPDVLIDLEGRKVGIELTELFVRHWKSDIHSQPARWPVLQAVESITNSILSKARKVYFDAGNPPVLVQVVFSNRIGLDKRTVNQTAAFIADKIQGMGIQNSQVIDWRSSGGESEGGLLSQSVVFIHARGVPELRFARWTVARSGWVATLTPKHLQDRIDKKANKIDSYKKNTEEIWLLIIADRTRPSQNFTCPSDFDWGALNSPFARTFYYSYPDGVIELKRSHSRTAKQTERSR